MNKELQELKEYVDSIATTARLLGYGVYMSNYTVTLFNPTLNGSLKFCMEVSVYDDICNTIQVTRFHETLSKTFSKECHEEKIKLLQTLLKAL